RHSSGPSRGCVRNEFGPVEGAVPDLRPAVHRPLEGWAGAPPRHVRGTFPSGGRLPLAGVDARWPLCRPATPTRASESHVVARGRTRLRPRLRTVNDVATPEAARAELL